MAGCWQPFLHTGKKCAAQPWRTCEGCELARNCCHHVVSLGHGGVAVGQAAQLRQAGQTLYALICHPAGENSQHRATSRAQSAECPAQHHSHPCSHPSRGLNPILSSPSTSSSGGDDVAVGRHQREQALLLTEHMPPKLSPVAVFDVQCSQVLQPNEMIQTIIPNVAPPQAQA